VMRRRPVTTTEPVRPTKGDLAARAENLPVGKRPSCLWRRWSLLVPVVVLLAAVTVQGVDVFREVPKPRALHLAQAIPTSAPGWTGRDLPLGANEFTSKEAEKVLNFDEVVYREYRRGEVFFTAYTAYWGAGKMPTRFVADHTPDRCWTENGWRCLEMKFRQVTKLDGKTLQPAEWRLFEPPNGGKPTYVLYWHLVEGRIYDYGERFNSIPDPFRWCKDAVQQALLGSREQYFIRVASSEPPEKLWSDAGFIEVMRGLERLGLKEKAGKALSNL